jgi:hypothetical protein
VQLLLDYLDLVCDGDELTNEIPYRAAVRFLARSASRDQLLDALDIRTLYWALLLSPDLLGFPKARQEIKYVVNMERSWHSPQELILTRNEQDSIGAVVRVIVESTDLYMSEILRIMRTNRSVDTPRNQAPPSKPAEVGLNESFSEARSASWTRHR